MNKKFIQKKRKKEKKRKKFWLDIIKLPTTLIDKLGLHYSLSVVWMIFYYYFFKMFCMDCCVSPNCKSLTQLGPNSCNGHPPTSFVHINPNYIIFYNICLKIVWFFKWFNIKPTQMFHGEQIKSKSNKSNQIISIWNWV